MEIYNVQTFFIRWLAPLLILSFSWQSANAGLILEFVAATETFKGSNIYTETDRITVKDNGGIDSDSSTGVVTFAGIVGAYEILHVMALSKPVLGISNYPVMDFFGGVISRSSKNTQLKISLTDTDYNGPLPGAKFFSATGGTTDGTVEYKTYLDPDNREFGTDSSAQLLGSLDFLTAGGFGDDVLTYALTNNPYSLTMELLITHGPAQSKFGFTFPTLTTFDAELSDPITEPNVVLLLGSALLGFGLTRKIKRHEVIR